MKTVFLHGFSGGASGSLRPLIDALQLDPEDVVAFDLPGFRRRADAHISEEILEDVIRYSEEVEQAILKHCKGDEQIRIIAYSHGAMPAFLFAHRHSGVVAELVLICPLSSPRLAVSLLPRTIRSVSKIIGTSPVLRVMQLQPIVDAVTYYSKKPYWTNEVLRQRLETRRRESRFYNENMFYLMRQLGQFEKRCAQMRVSNVPTKVIFSTDEEVASAGSAAWYADHINHAELVPLVGGHALPVVMPEKIAAVLQDS